METSTSPHAYRQWLIGQLEDRRKRQPSYSLRSFAGKLGVSPASLSQVISGKRPLSKKMALQFADRLCLSPHETETLVRGALTEKFDALTKDLAGAPAETGTRLELDTFHLISDWYHYAILNLVEMKEARSAPEWYAKRLGISVLDAHRAILRLKRVGLLKLIDGKLKRTAQQVTTSTDISSTAIRKYHYQNLKKAEEALDREGVSTRDFGAVTLAIDPTLLPKAKQVLQRARRQVSSVLSSGKKERVYTLVTQLFPVDRN